MWIGDVATYSHNYRIYAIDFPGEPGRSQATRFDLAGSASVEWMDDVLEGLGLDRITLLGISLGGWMALKYATQYPQRVEKLVLFCPGGVAPEKQTFFFRALPYLFLGEWGSGKIFRILNAGQPLDHETVRFGHLINSNFQPRLHGGPLFSDQELSRLHMPVLLVAGAQDTLIDTEFSQRRLRRLLPCFTEDILPSAGHILVNMADRVLPFLIRN
jgi:pimeloyl-ACP methyl ester carboxylesterase